MSEQINVDVHKKVPLYSIMKELRGLLYLQMSREPNNEMPAIPLLRGDPGIGKTAMLSKMCNEAGYKLLTTDYGLKPQEDISGIPDFGKTIIINGVERKKTDYTTPELVGDAWELSENGKEPIVIFLDDFHMASLANMALGYEMFTYWKLRNIPFPPMTAFIIAANVGSKSLANLIPSPIVNRCAIYNVTVDFEQWKAEYAIPKKINSKIVSFLSNPLYNKHFQGIEQQNDPWPSARQWTRFSILLNAFEQFNQDTSHQKILTHATAHVGNEAASAFAQFYQMYGSIEADKIFDENLKIEIPSDMSQKYAYMMSTIYVFFEKYANNKKQDYRNYIIDKMSNIIINMASSKIEIAVSGIKEIVITQKSLKLKELYEKLLASINFNNSVVYNRLQQSLSSL